MDFNESEGTVMRASHIVLCLLFIFIHVISFAEEPEQSKPPEKEAIKAPEEKATQEVSGEEKSPEADTVEAPPEEKRKPVKWTKIEGADFAYRNIHIAQGSYSFVTQFDGEMINNTGMDYSIVKFTFATFDNRGREHSKEDFHVVDFKNGEIKPFRGTTVAEGYKEFKEIDTHKIKFKSAVAAASAVK